jgi:membrane-associated phospholipid phosphatase
MPSGDTIQGAQMCFAIYLFFQSYYVLFVIPMVALGRIYFRCHWIGDTIVGGILGILYATIGYAYFPKFAAILLFHLSNGAGAGSISTKMTH